MAVLIVPSAAILGVVDEAIAKGVKALVVISAGFKETGHEGAVLEAKLRDKVQAAGIPLIGPNCLGIINTDPDVQHERDVRPEDARPAIWPLSPQSGALCTSVLDYAEERQMGFSKFVSFGNKADVNEIDLLSYLAKDEKTSVIAMYLEDMTNGRRFIETVRNIFWETHKPMLCLKSGRSPEGAKAVSSHTGSLAGSDSVYDALLAQSGVQRVQTIAELFDCAALYTTQPMPRGGRLAIVTNAGGPGIMATDAAVHYGLKLAELSDATKEKLKPALPAAASLRNPVDVIGDARADRYRAACARFWRRKRRYGAGHSHAAVDDRHRGDGRRRARVDQGNRQAGGLFVHGRPGRGRRRADSSIGGRSELSVSRGRREEPGRRRTGWLIRLKSRGGPKRFSTTSTWPGAKKLIADLLNDHPNRYLTQSECRPLFSCYRLPLLKSAVATSADEAAEAVAESLAHRW